MTSGIRVADLVRDLTANGSPRDFLVVDSWIVDVIAPFGGTDEMIKDLKLKVFPDRELRVLTVEAGKLGVRVV